MRIFVSVWRHGLSFDVQHHRKPDDSFRGHLWTWDYRFPFTLARQD